MAPQLDETIAAPDMQSSLLGTLCVVTSDGVPWVDYPGNPRGPMPARIVTTVCAQDCVPGTSVVLLFDGNLARPVITGVVSERIAPSRHEASALNRRGQDVVVDGRRVVLEGHEEIVLRCGRGSITLTANGRVVLKGTELVSRSSGTNKIRGATVNIN
jgi:hypothetical protein